MSGESRALFRRRSAVAEMLYLSGALLRQRGVAARRDWSSRAIYVAAGSAALLLFFMILIGSYSGARALVDARAYALWLSIPAWAFLVYLFTDLFIAFGQALGDLYLAADMPALLSMPLRVSSIVVAKFVGGVVQNEIYVATFLLPFVTGYLAGSRAPWWSYPVALIAIAVFPAMLYALLAAVTILALRYIPSQQAKEALWLIGAVVPTTFWVASFSGIARASGDISTLRLPAPWIWLPSTWVGNVVSLSAAGRWTDSLVWFAFLLFATLAVCPAALAFISGSFIKGWSESLSVATRYRVAGHHRTQRAPIWLAMARKDAWTLARTPQLWFSHITSLGFIAYLLVGHRVQTPLLPLTIQLAMIQIGFVALLAGLNPGMTALSLEHNCVWILRAMPIPALDVLRAKFAVAWGQTAVVVCFGAAALGYGYGFSLAATAALITFALCMSMVSIGGGLAFDSTFPSFSWENPNAINRGVRMVIPFLAALAVLSLCAAILGAMRVLFHGAIGVVVGLVVCLGITAWVVSSALRTSLRRLERLEV